MLDKLMVHLIRINEHFPTLLLFVPENRNIILCQLFEELNRVIQFLKSMELLLHYCKLIALIPSQVLKRFKANQFPLDYLLQLIRLLHNILL